MECVCEVFVRERGAGGKVGEGLQGGEPGDGGLPFGQQGGGVVVFGVVKAVVEVRHGRRGIPGVLITFGPHGNGDGLGVHGPGLVVE